MIFSFVRTIGTRGESNGHLPDNNNYIDHICRNSCPLDVITLTKYSTKYHCSMISFTQKSIKSHTDNQKPSLCSIDWCVNIFLAVWIYLVYATDCDKNRKFLVMRNGNGYIRLMNSTSFVCCRVMIFLRQRKKV